MPSGVGSSPMCTTVVSPGWPSRLRDRERVGAVGVAGAPGVPGEEAGQRRGVVLGVAERVLALEVEGADVAGAEGLDGGDDGRPPGGAMRRLQRQVVDEER